MTKVMFLIILNDVDRNLEERQSEIYLFYSFLEKAFYPLIK